MKKLRCKSGLRKNGTAWYMVDGKFVNKATFTTACYATDREEADIAAMGAVITPATVCKPTWNYDISPTLLLVISVLVLVFVMVFVVVIGVGDAKVNYCGYYKPWVSHGKIWFVENTCRDLSFTR